jgi:hypothetical protein
MKYLVWLIPAFLSVNSVNAQQPRPDSQSVLDARAQRGDMNDFDAANQKFVQAARTSNREALLDTLSPATKKDSATTLNKFLENVVSYFADFEQPISCNGITMVKDEYGNLGYIFHKAFKTKEGKTKPYKMALVRENGIVHVSNVAPTRTEFHQTCYRN